MDCPKRSTVARDLPEDSLAEILAHVPARSLYRSKCVAKAWRDVIEDPFHRKWLPQTLQGFFLIIQDFGGLHHIGYASLIARSKRLQIDPSISLLTKLPGFCLTFLNSCNGLLVFEHIERSKGCAVWNPIYVVWNPTTKQWGEVPRNDRPPRSLSWLYTGPYLVFDPAVSSHFHLVLFEEKGIVVQDNYDDDAEQLDFEVQDFFVVSVNVYSSESGRWIHIECDWDKHNLEGCRLVRSFLCAVLNGMLHFVIRANDKVQTAAVDVQGVARKFIPVPITAEIKPDYQYRYVVRSQGRLHYINKTDDAQLSIWVLEDYDTQKWVLKHSVSFIELFGKPSHQQCGTGCKNDYTVVAMHPDGNVVFIVQDWNRKLISYDMDHKPVSVIGTLENGNSTMHVVPYVPCSWCHLHSQIICEQCTTFLNGVAITAIRSSRIR